MAIYLNLQLLEDEGLSNKRIEQYVLTLVEEVISRTAAWKLAMANEKGAIPSGVYLARVHNSDAFKQRLAALMEEKAQLGETVWGRLEWQARQVYRKCVATNDPKGMLNATELLFKIASRNEKPAPKLEAENEDKPARGRGAPPAASPQPEDNEMDYHARRLIEKA